MSAEGPGRRPAPDHDDRRPTRVASPRRTPASGRAGNQRQLSRHRQEPRLHDRQLQPVDGRCARMHVDLPGELHHGDDVDRHADRRRGPPTSASRSPFRGARRKGDTDTPTVTATSAGLADRVGIGDDHDERGHGRHPARRRTTATPRDVAVRVLHGGPHGHRRHLRTGTSPPTRSCRWTSCRPTRTSSGSPATRIPARSCRTRASSQAFLDGGGRLFMSGQDILDQAAGTTAFVHDYLHIDWDGTETQNDKATETVTASHGTLRHRGIGSSAARSHRARGNVRGPDHADRRLRSRPSPTTRCDRRRSRSTGTYKVVFLAFPFEAYGSAADKTALMGAVLGTSGKPSRKHESQSGPATAGPDLAFCGR